MPTDPQEPTPQNWIARDQIAFVEFNGEDLAVYTPGGLKIGFLGTIEDRESFAEAIVRSKAKWIRVPAGLQPLPMGIAQ